MDTNLNFEGIVSVLVEQFVVLVFNESDWLLTRLGVQDVTQRDVLETNGQSDIVIVWNVDTSRDTRTGKG
ncbi:hypothetical protein WICPIJ_006134 [Wickerhamomyces pijperi]|uniref:Uncharacterized protein n=1 Tax=Wickerhamomyces pijperi TaxID=599730 RepID=A0A9P8Q2N0_WICPI|nr:hypothetical protein WICPIJ_006134 [Wickerhamomyces pijperi]